MQIQEEIIPGRMTTVCPIPIKIEEFDPELISTCSEQNCSQEQNQNMDVDMDVTITNSSNTSDEILQQTPKALEVRIPVELEKQDKLVIRPKRARRSAQRERDVPAGIVLDSFKRVIFNLDESSRGRPTHRTDDTVKPDLLLGSILKVLSSDSKKNTPIFTELHNGETADETVIDEIDGDYDPMMKIEVSDCTEINTEPSDEPDEFCASQSHPETETPYPQIVPSSEDLDFISRDDSDQLSTTSNGVLVKIEPEDPLGFSYPTAQDSPSFINQEPAGPNLISKSRTNLKTYGRKKGQSKTISISNHINGTGNVLSHNHFEEERKCLVCDESFLSGDALATHLYGHIPLAIWQSKALGFGGLSFCIPQVHESDEEETSDSIPVDPLALVNIKTEVNEMESRTQNITDNSVTTFDGSTSQDRRTEFEKRYPSLSKRTLNLKNPSNKSRISKKMKTAEVPNLNMISNMCPPPPPQTSASKPISSRQKGVNLKSEVKAPVQKSQAKIFKPQRRDGSNCPFGFGDVVQKLVEKGTILTK